ncbi:MAG: hypothetical protein Q4C71_04425 [Microbacteriaceae bacterium]|nr:hypothetical protein [Microbacteriaceae bacterium]
MNQQNQAYPQAPQPAPHPAPSPTQNQTYYPPAHQQHYAPAPQPPQQQNSQYQTQQYPPQYYAQQPPQHTPQKPRKKRGRGLLIFSIILLLLIAGGATFAYFKRNQISNWLSAQQYTPSSEVQALTAEIPFTEDGKLLFYATHPKIHSHIEGKSSCSGVSVKDEGSVLGCYTHENRIHLFSITDKRLHGVMEVTAAHETLHAAWAQLDEGERNKLAQKLADFYAEYIKKHPEFAERMKIYEGLNQSGFRNELHSVIGTEVAEIPDWLEQHYRTFFTDRAKLVQHYKNYSGIFASLKNQAERLMEDMKNLRADIETRSNTYKRDLDEYNKTVTDINRRNQALEFSNNPDAFYRLRDTANKRAAELDRAKRELETDIDRYNKMRSELQELSNTSLELEKSLKGELGEVRKEP